MIWTRSDSDGNGENQLRCYAYGDTVGRLISEATVPTTAVALRTDGEGLVWMQQVNEAGDQELVVADYGGGTVSGLRRIPTYSDERKLPDFGCNNFVVGAAWAGGHRLVLECSGQGDQPGGIVVQELTPTPASGRAVDPPESSIIPAYDTYSACTMCKGTTALVIESASCDLDCAKAPRSRAVRVDLLGGRLLEVIATPLPGRSVTSVSGGPGGIFYITSGSSEQRAYVRLPGERHGMQVTGLPKDLPLTRRTVVLMPVLCDRALARCE